MWQWIMIMKGHGRNWAWSNLTHYPGTCLEGLRETTVRGSGCGNGDSNQMQARSFAALASLIRD
jgi:hypothetical protein